MLQLIITHFWSNFSSFCTKTLCFKIGLLSKKKNCSYPVIIISWAWKEFWLDSRTSLLSISISDLSLIRKASQNVQLSTWSWRVRRYETCVRRRLYCTDIKYPCYWEWKAFSIVILTSHQDLHLVCITPGSIGRVTCIETCVRLFEWGELQARIFMNKISVFVPANYWRRIAVRRAMKNQGIASEDGGRARLVCYWGWF